jgi:hypothetical protein
MLVTQDPNHAIAQRPQTLLARKDYESCNLYHSITNVDRHALLTIALTQPFARRQELGQTELMSMLSRQLGPDESPHR